MIADFAKIKVATFREEVARNGVFQIIEKANAKLQLNISILRLANGNTGNKKSKFYAELTATRVKE